MGIAGWIDRQAGERPDKAALRFRGRDTSYAGLARAVSAAAGWLAAAHGVGRGDRIAWLGTNAPDMLVLLFAAARLGAVLVPLNWRLAPPELCYVLGDCRPRLLVAQPAFAAVAREVVPTGCALVGSDPDSGGLAERIATQAPFEDSGGDGDPVLIVYTSGTTGRPKGAVLTQAALAANADNACHMHALSAADHVLTVLPMFHVGGLNIQTTPALREGATVTLHERFEPGATLAAIAAERPTLTVLVPTTLKALIDHPGWAAAELRSLRAIATGSTDVPLELMAPFIDRGVPVIQVYGATETGPVAVYQRIGDPADELGAIGRPAPGCAVRLLGEDGADVAAGAVGEIAIKGANVAAGYWNDPAASEAALGGGWFRTGDLATRDARGAYWFRDRLRNVIVSGGENIYPAELERVLRRVDGLAEAAVVDRPDPRWGRVPVAVVVWAPGATPDRERVLAAFEGRLARYKHPRDVVFVDALPRNAMGKVVADRLREIVRS